MSTTNMEKMRTRLIAERDQLRKNRDSLRGDSLSSEVGELTNVDQNHPGDLGTETFEKEKDRALAANVEGTLAQIEDALARIDNGTYGTCERCGKPIPTARLNAIPYAVLCVECQEHVENTQ